MIIHYNASNRYFKDRVQRLCAPLTCTIPTYIYNHSNKLPISTTQLRGLSTLANVQVVINVRLISCVLIILLTFHDTLKVKGKFLYSAVSSPQDRSKRFILYFSDRPVHSDTISASLGSIQPHATINARRLLVHISNTVYSQVLIYSAE